MDSVLDFPNRITLTDAFRNDHGDLAALAASMRKSQGLYEMAGAFLECHDEPRFPSGTQDGAVRSRLCCLECAYTHSLSLS